MKNVLFTLAVFLVTLSISVSEEEWSYKPYGYVKTDAMYDSRQTVNAREGDILFYPANKQMSHGEDINDVMNFNILSIQTRFGFKLKAPDFLGAKSSGLIEGEFFGSADGDVGSVRLRHAFVKLDWGSCELLAGHYWNPLFIEDAFAQTISFNTGIPFVAFSRNPMIKFTYKPGNFKIHLSAISERDFPSTGPGGASSSYLRNSALPMLNLGVNYNDGTIFLAANTSYKEIQPRLVSSSGYKDENRAKGITSNFLARYTTEGFFVTASALYGQNTHDLLMIGGYAVKSISPIDSTWEYTPVNTGSAWIDTQYGKEFSIGFFGGYCKNFGADDEIAGAYYSRGNNIDYIYRLSPRIVYKTGMTQFAAEFEYTTAAYGTNDKMGKVINSEEVANMRVLLSASIYF